MISSWHPFQIIKVFWERPTCKKKKKRRWRSTQLPKFQMDTMSPNEIQLQERLKHYVEFIWKVPKPSEQIWPSVSEHLEAHCTDSHIHCRGSVSRTKMYLFITVNQACVGTSNVVMFECGQLTLLCYSFLSARTCAELTELQDIDS